MPIFGSFSGARSFGKGGGGGAMKATSSGNIATPTSGLQPGNGFTYHTFTGPGTFTVQNGAAAEVMVIGGGGGGAGHAASGGGGAGGMAINHGIELPAGSYTITVGDGGTGGPQHNLSYSGSPSSFSGNGITITGNGGGGAGAYSQGKTGGCGGGGAGYPSWTGGYGDQTLQSQPTNTKNYGSHGGYRWYGSYHCGNGGGGTRQSGENAPSQYYPGTGGDGMQWPQFNGPLIGLPGLAPLSGYFGGGGGGGGWSENSSPYAGGAGGGGAGNYNPQVGVANTGSGGGGANGYYYSNYGQGGGKGIVVVRYSNTSTKVYSTAGGSGLSSSNPGTSAYQIKKDYPSSADGFYWIQASSGPVIVYCDMTTDGGGWMHIHRCNGTGTSGVSATTTRSAVGTITGVTPGTTTGSIPGNWKLSDNDINYFMQWAIPGVDRPTGHSLPCFRVHCGGLGPSDGAWDYFTCFTNQQYGHGSGLSNANIDFRGGPYYSSGKYGSFSMSGWDTYAQFTNSPNSYTYASGQSTGTYTSWGTTLFYNHNGWGQGIIYNSSSNGFYTGGSWTSTGGLWYR